MNYRKIYISIIKKAKSENRKRVNKWVDKEKTLLNENWKYYEKHHILPKSLFPLWADKKSNLVLLSAREHYFCHQLLIKIYKNNNMIYALWRLSIDGQNKYCKVTSRTYELLKVKYSHCRSEANKTGNFVTNNPGKRSEQRLKVSLAHKGIKLSEEHKLKIGLSVRGEKNGFFGKKHSEKTIERISKNNSKYSLQCVETGEKFESLKEIDRKMGINGKCCLKVAKGEWKQFKGYHFILLSEKEFNKPNSCIKHYLMSDETKKKIGKSNRASARKYKCIETGIIHTRLEWSNLGINIRHSKEKNLHFEWIKP